MLRQAAAIGLGALGRRGRARASSLLVAASVSRRSAGRPRPMAAGVHWQMYRRMPTSSPCGSSASAACARDAGSQPCLQPYCLPCLSISPPAPRAPPAGRSISGARARERLPQPCRSPLRAPPSLPQCCCHVHSQGPGAARPGLAPREPACGHEVERASRFFGCRRNAGASGGGPPLGAASAPAAGSSAASRRSSAGARRHTWRGGRGPGGGRTAARRRASTGRACTLPGTKQPQSRSRQLPRARLRAAAVALDRRRPKASRSRLLSSSAPWPPAGVAARRGGRRAPAAARPQSSAGPGATGCGCTA